MSRHSQTKRKRSFQAAQYTYEFMSHSSFKLVKTGFVLKYKQWYAFIKCQACFIQVGVAVHHEIQLFKEDTSFSK